MYSELKSFTILENAGQGNSASPAFEHKVDGKLVHINESTPDWIKKELESLKFDRRTEKKSSKDGRGICYLFV